MFTSYGYVIEDMAATSNSIHVFYVNNVCYKWTVTIVYLSLLPNVPSRILEIVR